MLVHQRVHDYCRYNIVDTIVDITNCSSLCNPSKTLRDAFWSHGTAKVWMPKEEKGAGLERGLAGFGWKSSLMGSAPVRTMEVGYPLARSGRVGIPDLYAVPPDL